MKADKIADSNDGARELERLLSDVGQRPSEAHSLDRINNDGHYEPGNVRWATRREQQRNRRPSCRLVGGVS